MLSAKVVRRIGEFLTQPVLVVLTGAVGSGKTTAARVAAAHLRSDGRIAATVDLDLLYQMRDESYGDQNVWRDARQAAAALADVFFGSDAEVVIVDGGFFNAEERDQLLRHVATDVMTVFVTVQVSFGVALERVQDDAGRTFTKMPEVLRWLHDQFDLAFPYLSATGHVIDADRLSVDDVAAAIIELLPSPVCQG